MTNANGPMLPKTHDIIMICEQYNVRKTEDP